MQGTREYLKTITNKQFQKDPKTFLHNESYMNDYSDELPQKLAINIQTHLNVLHNLVWKIYRFKGVMKWRHSRT